MKESDDLVILGVSFDAKMTFKKYHCFVSARVATQRLGIMKKSWQVFHDRSLHLRSSGALSCRSWSIAPQCGNQLLSYTSNY